jgi:TonB family protein
MGYGNVNLNCTPKQFFYGDAATCYVQWRNPPSTNIMFLGCPVTDRVSAPICLFMFSRSITRKGLILASFASATMTGCMGPEFVAEHPVDNPIPPLKSGVYSVKTVDVRPMVTHEVEPDYPAELGSILGGRAVVLFTVRADGKVTDASVLEADDVLFGDAAVEAVRKWRFRPAEIGGSPVDCRMTLPFAFSSPYGRLPGDDSEPEPSRQAPPSGSNQTNIEPHP